MKLRDAQRAVAGAMAATFIVVIATAQAAGGQTQLPDGPGKEAATRVCGTCHPTERAASVRLTRDGWQNVIAKMVKLGARGSDEDLEATLDYLATHFKGEAAKPLNLNSATSIDLESIAGLFRKESAAWIAYRTKKGPCTTIDDLKKVPGVDFKKIDARRDRLGCF